MITDRDQRGGIVCPLCCGDQSRIAEAIDASKLVALWSDHLGIDIREDVGDVKQIERRICLACSLEFYIPPVTASENVYAQLRNRDWYYKKDKWEYGVALSSVPRRSRVLEVGCGDGYFVERLQREKGCEVLGLETNPAAVAAAQARHRPVVLDSVANRAVHDAAQFDVVTAFQVLEHVSEPLTFLADCCRVLKRGGLMILSVPNGRSFLRYEEMSILNMPPHHVTRWNRRAFESVSAILPVHVEKIRYEPLAVDHLNWYANVQLARLPWITGITGVLVKMVRAAGIPFVRWTRFYRLCRGHTLYVLIRRR